MTSVKLGDIAVEAKSSNKGDKSGCKIVGLEHLTPMDVTLSEWSDDTNNSFTKEFKKGDVLFGRRRAYLKKAAVAPFEGICSGDITVIRAIEDKVDPDLLPFIIQNDFLFEYAVGKSAGSLSPRVKWEHLRKFEFNLPDMKDQRTLADTLWSINETKQSYIALIKQTDELVKSQFIEMFGQLPEKFKHETVELGEIAEMVSGGTPSSKHPEYYGNKYPFVTTPCLGKNYINEDDAQNWLSEIGVNNSSTHIIPAFSIMYGSRVGVGKSSINTCEMCTNQDILSFFNIDKAKYDLLFIKKVMDQYFEYIDTQKRGSTIKGVPSDLVKAIKIPLVPIEEQKTFAEFTEQTDKSKFELQNAIDNLDALTKKIIAENLIAAGKE